MSSMKAQQQYWQYIHAGDDKRLILLLHEDEKLHGDVPHPDLGTALGLAAYLGFPDIAQVLLMFGATTDGGITTVGHSALHYACMGPRKCKERQLKLVRMLLQAGARVNLVEPVTGCTPLHYVFSYEAPNELVDLLMSAGAEEKAVNQFGHTPQQVQQVKIVAT